MFTHMGMGAVERRSAVPRNSHVYSCLLGSCSVHGQEMFSEAGAFAKMKNTVVVDEIGDLGLH